MELGGLSQRARSRTHTMDGDVLRLLETSFSGFSSLQSSSVLSHAHSNETHSAVVRTAGYMDTSAGGAHDQTISPPPAAVRSCNSWYAHTGTRSGSTVLEGEESSTSGGSFSEDSAIDDVSNLSSQPLSGVGLELGCSDRGKQKGRKRGRKGKEPPAPSHTHLGGMRRCRVPLSAEVREVLEVAWASRIIQPGVDGRKEKERIANVTGMSYSKVHEWFRNRRKKEKLVILRKKGLAPTPSKKWSPLTRQQSGSSSSSDLSLRLETANLESSAQGAVSATTSEVPSDLSAP